MNVLALTARAAVWAASLVADHLCRLPEPG